MPSSVAKERLQRQPAWRLRNKPKCKARESRPPQTDCGVRVLVGEASGLDYRGWKPLPQGQPRPPRLELGLITKPP